MADKEARNDAALWALGAAQAAQLLGEGRITAEALT